MLLTGCGQVQLQSTSSSESDTVMGIKQGLFMWFPDESLKGIEKNVEKNPVISKIITIPAENKGMLLDDLKMVGISSKSLFPDNIDFCCKELVRDITKDAYSA